MHIPHFMYFASDLLVAAYFYLYCRNDVRQKTNLCKFFYSSSKWVIKQQRQLTISIMNSAQELLTNVQGSGGSKSFAKETRALKMSTVVGH